MIGEGCNVSTDYKQLAVWQQAMKLVREIYQCTRLFPREEVFGLSSQMRRAAVSVPSNIAEGKGRYSQKELVQFLYKSRGSLLELETQICIARDLGYVDDSVGQSLATRTLEVLRILNGLINRFQQEIQEQSSAPQSAFARHL
jgi:four helix bundle protein